MPTFADFGHVFRVAEYIVWPLIRLKSAYQQAIFYKLLSETCGIEIDNDKQLMSLITELAEAKRSYDKIAPAISEVNRTGYGIISPDITDLSLEEPEIVKQGSIFSTYNGPSECLIGKEFTVVDIESTGLDVYNDKTRISQPLEKPQ